MSKLNAYSRGAVDATLKSPDLQLPNFVAPVLVADAGVGTSAAAVQSTATSNSVAPSRGTGIQTTSDTFMVHYRDAKGTVKNWKFVLLPAIETNLTLGSSSNLVRGSGAQVPEVKPGILTQTIMRQKNIPIPGGVPVVQTIGVDSQFTEFVGAFLGTENSGTNGLSAVYRGTGDDPAGTTFAGQKAQEFNDLVVQQGAPVTVTLKFGDRTTDYRGVIRSFKFYDVRDNRAYYSFQLLATEYRVNKQVKAPAKVAFATQEQRKTAQEFGTLGTPEDLADAVVSGVSAARLSSDKRYTMPQGSTVISRDDGAYDIDGTINDQIQNLNPADRKVFDAKVLEGLRKKEP